MNQSHARMLIVLFLLVFSKPTSADWSVYKKAEVRSENGHKLRIDRYQKGEIRGWLVLKRKIPGVFESRLPLYQIDDNKVHDLEEIKNKISINDNKDRWIRWAISDKNEPISSDLLEFMNGKLATFQYYLPDGTIYEATFKLKGAKKAIEAVLSEK
jgi:hypothetical protein